MKTAVTTVLSISVALLCFLYFFSTQFWSKAYARNRAEDYIRAECIADKRNPDFLSTLHEDTIPGKWSFEKTYQGKPRYLYGVWFHSDGTPEFYGGDPDDSNSAAYDHPDKTAAQSAAANP